MLKLLLLVALGLAAWAFHPPCTLASDPAGEPREADPPTLYTNADLERFGPPSAARVAASAAPREDETWEFVEGFLERQSRRIDADRRYELEVRALEDLRRQREEEALRVRPVVPFLFGTSFLGAPFFFPRMHVPRAAPPPPQVLSPHGRPFNPREFMNQRPTIHARPPLRSR